MLIVETVARGSMRIVLNVRRLQVLEVEERRDNLDGIWK